MLTFDEVLELLSEKSVCITFIRARQNSSDLAIEELESDDEDGAPSVIELITELKQLSSLVNEGSGNVASVAAHGLRNLSGIANSVGGAGLQAALETNLFIGIARKVMSALCRQCIQVTEHLVVVRPTWVHWRQL